MILRGIDFGNAWLGSGAAGFFGEGYWFHAPYSMMFPRGFCPDEFTFVAKTTTVESRLGETHGQEGNMELHDDLTPEFWFPDCVVSGVMGFWRKEMLNSIGLAGPGARALFERGEWQKRKKPFMLSFMTTKKGEEAIRQMEEYRDMLKFYLRDFCAPIGLQKNLSCPNAGVDLDEAARDACIALEIFGTLGIPLILKFNALMSVEVVKKIAEHPACDAIHVSNTIPYGKSDKIDWWMGEVSPLAQGETQYGGGGLSGAQLLPLAHDWLKAARAAGITKPINIGGGIFCAKDVELLRDADGISVATMFALRPWKARSILECANNAFSSR